MCPRHRIFKARRLRRGVSLCPADEEPAGVGAGRPVDAPAILRPWEDNASRPGQIRAGRPSWSARLRHPDGAACHEAETSRSALHRPRAPVCGLPGCAISSWAKPRAEEERHRQAVLPAHRFLQYEFSTRFGCHRDPSRRRPPCVPAPGMRHAGEASGTVVRTAQLSSWRLMSRIRTSRRSLPMRAWPLSRSARRRRSIAPFAVKVPRNPPRLAWASNSARNRSRSLGL